MGYGGWFQKGRQFDGFREKIGYSVAPLKAFKRDKKEILAKYEIGFSLFFFFFAFSKSLLSGSRRYQLSKKIKSQV